METEKALFDKKFIGSPVEIGTSAGRYGAFLAEGETVRMEFKGLRDALVFTDRRLIVIDPQGLRGRKVAVSSIPWKSVTGSPWRTPGRSTWTPS